MLGPDPEQQRRMAGEMDRSIEQIERETSAFFVRLVGRWAVRWAVVFAVIFLLTQSVDWLDWLWWIAVPIAVISLSAAAAPVPDEPAGAGAWPDGRDGRNHRRFLARGIGRFGRCPLRYAA